MEKLIFRRQFMLLEIPVQAPAGWREITLQNEKHSWHLYLHPDLNSISARKDSVELVLIGYILDPLNPLFTDQDVMLQLLESGTFEQMVEKTDYYNGRFVLLFIDSDNLRIVNDATGFREVFYSFADNTFACGSTPDILARTLGRGCTEDRDVMDFYHSDLLKKRDHVWLGYKTIFQDILHLPPNHYLDFNAKRYIRFWPVKPLGGISLGQCARECAAILKGTVESAVERYPVHMGMTAGWDTRLLLAASKSARHKIFYYINNPSPFDCESVDLQISKKLSEIFDFKLNVININPEVDEDFKKVYYSNNSLAHEKLLAVFHDAYERKFESTYTVSGTMGNGLARIYFRIPGGIQLTGKNIAELVGYGDSKYVIDALDEWLMNVRPVSEKYNIDIMDLYQMEQDNTNWASLTASEQDIVREEVRPFNNRKLISLFWSLNTRYRFQNYPEIYVRIIKILWKEILLLPLNPTSRSWIFSLLRMLGLEQKIYYLKKRYELISALKKS